MSATNHNDPKEQPLVSHLIELRNRVLRCVICVLLVFLALFPFTNDIWVFFSDPMSSAMTEEGQQLIATKPMDTFFVPLTLTVMVAFFISIPYVMHQVWAFVAPGLYQNEIRVTMPILISSIVLFYAGLLFAYFLVIPLIFQFSVSSSPDNVAVMTDIGSLYQLEMRMFYVFGFVFEIPVATVLLILAGVLNPDSLKEHRGYVLIGCFFVGMIVTPPDVFSQSLVAIPMWLLFEAGLFAGRLLKRDEAAKAAEQAK
jgi:sec-independent protein translocase protein TatC